MISLADYLSSSGRYVERATHAECTDDVKANAADLLKRVNALLLELELEAEEVSSGFRPSDVNGKIKNAAKKSAHMNGRAIDLKDADSKLKIAIAARPDLLKKHGLMMEDAASTPTWLHLDTVARTPRQTQTFKP